MLTQNSMASVFPLAEQLDASNVVLIPIAGTPLDTVVSATRANDTMVHRLDDGEVVLDIFAIGEATNSKSCVYGQSQHDAVMGDVTAAATATVQRNISLARLQVAPLVTQLAETVAMRMANAAPSDVAKVEIRTGETVDVLRSPVLADLLEKFELTPANNPPINSNLPRLAVELELLPLLETGIASLDQDVAVWAAGLDSYIVKSVWEMFFCALSSRDTNEDGSPAPVTPGYEGMPFSAMLDGTPQAPLLVFLWARHLQENDKVLEGTEMGLKEYQAMLKAYVEQAGMWLCRQIDKVNTASKTGILVTSITGSVVNVNPIVYDEWLAGGGDNDILYGMLVSGKPAYTVGIINESAELYRDAWAKFQAITGAVDSNRRFSYLREQFVLVYENMLLEEENDGVKLDVRLVADIMNRFKNELAEITSAESLDLYTTSLKLVCRSRFYTTAAETILTKMDEVSKTNPKLSAREAGAVAVISYICDWVASQFSVTSA